MAKRILIGLTGNIATGKSAVAHDLRDLGAHIIDADQIAREVVMRGQAAFDEIVSTFGIEVVRADGELNRAMLGQIVFLHHDRLRQLEAIVHPAVHAEMERQLDALAADAVAVIEVIKLFENGWAERCTEVWVTHCAPETQVARLMQSRGMSEADARARVLAQNPQADKVARADVVIDTSGTLDDTRNQVMRAFHALNTRLYRSAQQESSATE